MHRKFLAIFLVCVAIIGAAGVVYYRHKHSDELPRLEIADLNQNREAGRYDRTSGPAFARSAVPSDTVGVESTANSTPGLVPLQEGTPFFMGTFFQLGPKGSVYTTTSGNWIVVMEGSGEFVFENASTNADRTIHSGLWFVRSGTFRAKPHDYDKGDHWLEIRTPKARVFLRKAEIGMRISEGGGGQIWLARGNATVVWNDGRRKELLPKGLDNL